MDGKQIILGVIVALVLVVAGLTNQVQIGGNKLDLGNIQSLSVSASCRQTDSSQTEANSFTCLASQCNVYGKLTCDSQSSSAKVTLRCGDGWFAWDRYNSGQLLYYRNTGNYVSGTGVMTRLALCPNGMGVYLYNGGLFYSSSSAVNGNIYEISSAPYPEYVSTSPQPAFSGKEVYSGSTGYTCTWKFCPGTYCDKAESGTSAWTKATPTVVLAQGETITFQPVDSSNLPLDTVKSVIYSTNYDCSAPICTIGDKKCVSSSISAECKIGTDGYNYWYEKPCTSPIACSNGVCTCPTTGDFCSQEGATACVDSLSLKSCTKDMATGCLKWARVESCPSNQVCTSGSCKTIAAMTLSGPASYSVNSPITIPVQISESAVDLTGNQVYVVVYDSTGIAKGSSQCILNRNLAIATYSCNAVIQAGISSIGTYTAKAVLQPSQLSGVKLEASQQFNVYMGAGVGIETDTIIYTHEQGVAYLSVKDSAGSPIPMCSQTSNQQCFERWMVEVKVNGQTVVYNLVPEVEAGKVKLTYLVPSIGPVSIKAWTDGGELTTTLAVRTDLVAQAPTIQLEYDIPGSVSYGLNKFTFKAFGPSNDPDIERVALDVPTDAIVVKIGYPDAHTESIHPTRTAMGSYSFNIDMPKDEGQAYTMTITAVYSNWPTKTTPTIHVNAQSSGNDPVSGTDWAMFAIIGLGIVLVVVLAIAGVFRRKR